MHIPKNDLSALAGAPPDNSQVVSFSAFYVDENGELQKVSILYAFTCVKFLLLHTQTQESFAFVCYIQNITMSLNQNMFSVHVNAGVNRPLRKRFCSHPVHSD